MKTIGLIGGMSWESSLEYYRYVNEGVRDTLGGFHSAPSVMVSVDFAEIEKMQKQGDWEAAARAMIAAARAVELAGADFVLICTNTMHKLADEVEAAIDIPLLHIADATAEVVCAQGISRVGLLGTRYTMEEDFYRGRLEQKFGLKVLIPHPEDRELVHRVIYEELVLGKLEIASRQAFSLIAEKMIQEGAQGIILGCTEIGLLLKPEDSQVPLFDTTRLHAEAAVETALGLRKV